MAGDLLPPLWELRCATPQVVGEAGAQSLEVEGGSHNLEEERESLNWAVETDWVSPVELVAGLPS